MVLSVQCVHEVAARVRLLLEEIERGEHGLPLLGVRRHRRRADLVEDVVDELRALVEIVLVVDVDRVGVRRDLSGLLVATIVGYALADVVDVEFPGSVSAVSNSPARYFSPSSLRT